MPIDLGRGSAYDYEKLVIGVAASGLTPAKRTTNSPVGAKFAVLRCTVADINYRSDGIAATAADGLPLKAGESVEIYGKDSIKNLSMIRSGGADATVYVQYYR